MKTKNEQAEFSVLTINKEMLVCWLLGSTPMIYNAMSFKAQGDLLLPKGRKNAAERASTLKHVPLEEYRNSVYAHAGDDRATRLMFPGGGIKGAMANAALDLPGLRKAEVGRLVRVEEDEVDVYGVPQILMSVVRNSDANHTPDIRSRAILRNWACQVSISYVKPLMKEKPVLDLLGAAGVLAGLGDWRPQKGKGSYGQFEVVSEDDKRLLKVLKNGGRDNQDLALQEPSAYDLETERLLHWYDTEIKKRGDERAPSKIKRKALVE